jgi:hypothetical protein
VCLAGSTLAWARAKVSERKRRLLRQPFALDEVAPSFLALLVALHHRQLLGHVEGQVVLDSRAAFSPVLGKSRVVLAEGESVLLDAGGDPLGELLAHFQEGVQLTRVDGLHRGGADGARGDVVCAFRSLTVKTRIRPNKVLFAWARGPAYLWVFVF